jgi:Tfp pilus assembly protein PilO
MPIELQFLKKIDRSLVGFAALLVISVAGIVATTLHLGTLRDGLEQSEQGLAQKQISADSVTLPSDEELGQWASTQNILLSRLISENDIPGFVSEITSLASQFQLGTRLGVDYNLVEIQAEAANLPVTEQLARAMGILRYTEVTLTFSGEYENSARFIQTIARLPRLIEFTEIDLGRTPPNVSVRMVMRIYQREDGA